MSSNGVYVDGNEIDYPADFELDAGYTHCILADHQIQREVDENGEPMKVEQVFIRGVPQFDERTRKPILKKSDPTAGCCEACWLEEHSNEYTHCRAHGNQRRVENVEGCPICAAGSDALANLDERERAVSEPITNEELERSEDEVRAQHRQVVLAEATTGAAEPGADAPDRSGPQPAKPGAPHGGNRRGVRGA